MTQLQELKIKALYEPFFIRYQHRLPHRYTPDIVLPNGIIIEAKGYFEAKDRTKHLLIRQEHPELDIRFVFQRSQNKLSPSSKMTYGGWCKKNGFLHADKVIPASWIEEPPSHDCQKVLKQLAVPIKRNLNKEEDK